MCDSEKCIHGDRVAQLLSNDLQVIGQYISGCNQDGTKTTREYGRYKKSELRKVRSYISNGKKDHISKLAHAESLERTMKEDRYGKVRLELFDGGHRINQDEFKKAMKWFIEP